MKLTKSIVAIALMATALTAWSQDDIKNTEFNPVTTGVTSLSITPDARGASMGDLGAATEADVNSQFWNPSKYAFAYSQAGVSLSYTPWLRKIVNDIYLANLSAFYKIGSGDNQAVSASLRYFSLGEVMATDGDGAVLMHLGAMAVIGAMKPKNIIHVVVNNGAHESVGGMPTVAGSIDLVSIARACGYPHAVCVDSFEALDK